MVLVGSEVSEAVVSEAAVSEAAVSEDEIDFSRSRIRSTSLAH